MIDHPEFITPVPLDESPSIAKLAEALSKAQGAMESAAKGSVNPHFNSRYADLASIWDACRGPLSANGLAVVQRIRTSVDGIHLTTMLIHSSGEWLRDTSVWPVLQKTPPGYGSAITYAKRYTLAALVGVAADVDDDGNAASVRPTEQSRQRTKSGQTAAAVFPAAQAPADGVGRTMKARRASVWSRAKGMGQDEAAFRVWSASVLGKNVPTTEWTEEDVARLEVAQQQPPDDGQRFPDGGA